MISLIANTLLLANLIILLLSFYANVVFSSSKASLMLSNVSTSLNSGLMLCLIWAFACSDFSFVITGFKKFHLVQFRLKKITD